MSEPIGQHTVPKCYLKNFNTKIIYKKKKAKYFVDIFDKKEDTKGCNQRDIDGICKINEFYTFSKLPDDKKRCFEKLFSKTIETDYGLLYPLLIDKNQIKLSNTQKVSLISFVITQFFRTSILTNFFVQIAENMVKRGSTLTLPEKGITKMQTINGNHFDFSNQNINEIIKDEKVSAKENVNVVKLQLALDILKLRKDDIVSIAKIHPSHFLITSDTPVFFLGNPINSDTIIKMPINHEYIFSLLPKSRFNEFNSKEIFRSEMEEEFSSLETTSNNLHQVSKSERFIIGKEENIKNALLLESNINTDNFINQAKKYTSDTVSLAKDLGYDLGIDIKNL